LPDTHPQVGRVAARSTVAERRRRRHADWRPAQLAAVARQGQGTWGEPGSKKFIQIDNRAEGDGQQRRDRRAQFVGDIGLLRVGASSRGSTANWPPAPSEWVGNINARQGREHRQDVVES